MILLQIATEQIDHLYDRLASKCPKILENFLLRLKKGFIRYIL